jgi:hypothetical protein
MREGTWINQNKESEWLQQATEFNAEKKKTLLHYVHYVN